HCGIAVAPTVLLGRLHQPFHLPLGQALAGPVFGIGFATNCALFVSWGDHFEGRNSSHFPLLWVRTMHLSFILYIVVYQYWWHDARRPPRLRLGGLLLDSPAEFWIGRLSDMCCRSSRRRLALP